jgi:hypothetical protein
MSGAADTGALPKVAKNQHMRRKSVRRDLPP